MNRLTIQSDQPKPICNILAIACAISMVFLLAGCPPQTPPEPIPAPISLTEALSRYNRNVANVPQFRVSIASWELYLYDPETSQTHHHSDLGGGIYFRPAINPDSRPQLYLRANTGIGGDALVIGTNNTEFWLYSKVANRGWWGTHNNAASYHLPLNPNTILQSLLLAPIPDNPAAPPYPVFRIEPEYNVISYIVPQPDGLFLQREIIIDRRSDLPIEIRDYNQQAILVRQTQLSDYEAIADNNAPENAMLPRNIIITSSQDGSSLKLQLNHYQFDPRNRDRLFVRPTNPVDNYLNITASSDNYE